MAKITLNIIPIEITFHGKTVSITPVGGKIIKCLAEENRVYSRSEIREKVWEESKYISLRNMDVHKKRIDEDLPGLIKSVHGVGYRIDEKYWAQIHRQLYPH